MAQFCTKCGIAVPEGMRFCTGCGATIGEPSAPSAPTPPVATPAAPVPFPAPAPPAAPAPAAKSGSPVRKIILIVVAVVILLSLLGVVACAYWVYHTAKQRALQIEKQVQTTFPMPTGTQEAPPQPMAPGAAPTPGTAPAADLASLSYPGATASGGGSQPIFSMGGIKVQEYTTSDPVDTVVAYYKAKLGPRAMVRQTGGNTLLQLMGANAIVSVTIQADQASGKTKITVSSIGK